jgi:hypothetical protein
VTLGFYGPETPMMNLALTRGVLAISIDLELDTQRRGIDQQRALEDITGRLIQMLGKYNFPATWAVADPAVSAATERLMAAKVHEIAILGDRSWVGREAGRSRFAREIARRVTRGRAAGMEISTLVVREADPAEHLDIVVKQGLNVVRTATHDARSRGVKQPQPLRFGLWEMPVSLQLPGASRWAPGGGSLWIAKRRIGQSAQAPAVFHLVVDSLAMAAKGSAAQGVLDKVLRHAAHFQSRNLLTVATLAATAAQLSGERRATSARSILRPAA